MRGAPMPLETTHRDMLGGDVIERALERLRTGDRSRAGDRDMSNASLAYQMDVMFAMPAAAPDVDDGLREACRTCMDMLLDWPPEGRYPDGYGYAFGMEVLGYACVAGSGLDAAAGVVEGAAAKAEPDGWDRTVLDGVSRALLSLARGDHAAAHRTVESLRGRQKGSEGPFIDGCGEEYRPGTAMYLAAMYYLAGSVDDATAVCRGEEDGAWLAGRLDGHFESAERLLDGCGDRVLVTKLGLLRTALNVLAEKYGKT